jgi:hypothetical protein
MFAIGIMLVLVAASSSVFGFNDNREDSSDGVSPFTGYSCGKPLEPGDDMYYVMDIMPPMPPAEGASPPTTIREDLPSEFSWKDYEGGDWTTPAKNQGACGSCWDFAAVGTLEAVINIAWDDPDLDMDLSEQYVLSCLPKAGSCAGGSTDLAFKYIKSTSADGNYHNGIIPEECFFYQASHHIPCSEKCLEWIESLVPITGYGYWYPDFPDDIDFIKTQIMERGPIATYFMATGDFASWGSSHHDPEDYYPYMPADSINHAVVLLGWKDDPTIGNGGYWILKNSWGTAWGYNGFFNMEYGSLNVDNCFIVWVSYAPVAPVGINLTRPREGTIYLFDHEILSNQSITAMIGGPLTIEATAIEVLFGIDRVEFSLGDTTPYVDDEFPYEWQPNSIYIGPYTLTITAYNTQGDHAIKEQDVLLFYLGIN